MKTIRNIFIFGFTFFITLFFSEVFLQTAEVSSLSVTKNDTLLGMAVKPDKNLIFFDEGFYMGGTNKYGYYGPSYTPLKDSSTIRIALVGDSYVEAHQLFDRNSMRALIEKQLQKRIKKKVEVLNFGMSGFNLNDDYCYYRNFVSKFHPDYLLFFVSNEDFSASPTSNRRPQCAIKNDSLIIKYDFRQNSKFKYLVKTQWFRGKSIILSWIYKAREIINRNLWQPVIFDKFYHWVSKGSIKPFYENDDKKLELQAVTIKIIEKLSEMKNIYFVEKEPLKQNIQRILIEKKLQLIQLNSINNKKYHYWKVTNTYGHWNAGAHKIVAHIIVKRLSSDINQKKSFSQSVFLSVGTNTLY